MNRPSSARRSDYRLPIALLADAFRPLGFFATEFLAALAPLAPEGILRRLFPLSDLGLFSELQSAKSRWSEPPRSER